MKYTPGPWKIEQYQSTHKCHEVNFRCQSEAADGLTNCCYSERGKVSIIQDTPGSQIVICDMAKGENGYNATLIEAAPKMLEALKDLIAEFDARNEEFMDIREGYFKDTAGIAYARTIIAKVEGGGA